MPFAPHAKLTVRGGFMNGATKVEEFSYGMAITQGPGDAGVPDAEDLASAVEAVQDFHSLTAGIAGSHLVVQEIKMAHIGVDGKYTADPQIATVSFPGGVATNLRYPPQCALVVSLLTDRRGASGRGRCFLPMTPAAMQPDFTIGAADAQAVADGFAKFIKDLASSPGTFGAGALNNVAVASSKGFNTPVLRVKVGRVVDTMRSRRRSIPEAYGPEVEAAVQLANPDE